VSAGSGGDGIARAIEQQPDVVVLDLMLPDRSGHDVCKALRFGTTQPTRCRHPRNVEPRPPISRTLFIERAVTRD
jgi:CheY-like chemotaxis protein